jgi:TM2 domain-containing membrane protein YozV
MLAVSAVSTHAQQNAPSGVTREVANSDSPVPRAPRSLDHGQTATSPRSARAMQDVKDPAFATTLSFFLPGTGQMYAGEGGRGAIMLGTYVAGATLVVVGASNTGGCSSYSSCGTNAGRQVAVAVGGIVMMGTYIYSVLDAWRAAERANADASPVRVMLAPGERGGMKVGLALSR